MLHLYFTKRGEGVVARSVYSLAPSYMHSKWESSAHSFFVAQATHGRQDPHCACTQSSPQAAATHPPCSRYTFWHNAAYPGGTHPAYVFSAKGHFASCSRPVQ